MEKEPKSSNPEDSKSIYERESLLVDYGNEYSPSHLGIDENGNIYRDSLVRTVEERFSEKSRQASESRLEAAKAMPRKVERINMLAGILNTTTDVTTFKRAINEMNRIVYGEDIMIKRGVMYPEPELILIYYRFKCENLRTLG